MFLGNLKRCSRCELFLPHNDYNKNRNKLRPECRDCRNRDEKPYRIAHKEQIALAMRKTKLKWKFGMTLEAYEKRYKEQSDCCLLCNRNRSEFKIALSVDHDHKTGKVRGLLCHDCNTGLGKFRDSAELLNKAAQYLIVGGNVPSLFL